MKSKLINYILLICLLIWAKKTYSNDNEFCTISKKLDEQCGGYTYKAVKPLLNYIEELQNTIESNNCDGKTAEILQLRNELMQTKDQVIELQNKKISRVEGEKNKSDVETLKTRERKVTPQGCIPFKDTPGVHRIYTVERHGIYVLCDSSIAGPGWIVIQKRITGEQNFFKKWLEYRDGFGLLTGDFFLGLENIYLLTRRQQHELYIHMETFDGQVEYARYDKFSISNIHLEYKLIALGTYSGNGTGDGMISQRNMKFSTYDRDNDNNQSTSCASKRYSGWWFGNCTGSNLNGKYFPEETKSLQSMSWKENKSLKKVIMLIRPTK